MDHSFIEEKGSNKAGFDTKRFLFKILGNYKIIIVSVFFFVLGANLYIRYKVPLYQLSTSLLINALQLQASLGNADGSVRSGGGLFNGNNAPTIQLTDIDNEMFIIQSATLMAKVCDSLHLDIDVTTNGRIKDQPIFIDSLPFKISVNKISHPRDGKPYLLNTFAGYYTVKAEKELYKAQYGQPAVVNGDTIKVSYNGVPIKQREYSLRISNKEAAAKKYSSRLVVATVPKAGNGMISVSVSDELPVRAKKIIDVLIYEYNLSNLEYQNQAIKLALDFLNSRLSAVDKELQDEENKVKDFKETNKVFDVSYLANQLLGSLKDLDGQKAQNDLKVQLLNLVENYVKSYNNKEEIVPNTNGFDDVVLIELINKYNNQVLQKRLVLDNGTTLDPRLETINGQLQELRVNILKNTANMRKQLLANDKFIKDQQASFTSRFNEVPDKEKTYIELSRILSVKGTLYTFLLEKREETNLQLISSDVQKSRIVDDGINNGVVVPNVIITYAVAAGSGLLLPVIIIFIGLLANTTIETKKEIKEAVAVPIAGEISFSGDMNNHFVTEASNRTPVAEQFRSLRANLTYIAQGDNRKTLLITSSVGGEGKSFISLNLANSLAVSGKKVVLLELDLRKPKLSEKLQLPGEKGISTYLVSAISEQEIIKQVSENNNLYFISSGPIPPNPGELILNNRLAVLFAYLKQEFDFIVIDSPPVGLISDAVTFGKFADVTLYIVRHKFTHRNSLMLLNDIVEEQKLPGVSIVINGIVNEKGFKYGYGYGYGYGYTRYGYSYGTYSKDDDNSGFSFKKIFGRKRN